LDEQETMARLPIGKLPAALLRKVLEAGPPPPAELLLPPRIGEDAGVISLRDGALVVAADPITLTERGIGAHAVVINANDVAVMGTRPRWFLAVILLPVGTTEADVRSLFKDMYAALARVGVALVGGHTEVTVAVTQPVVIGQMMGYREDGRFVKTGSVQDGDVILQIGAAPIEGAAVLANEAQGGMEGLEPDVLELARAAIEKPGISVVEPALRAAELGATALHDPTEGGLSVGLHELAEASRLAVVVEPDAVIWFEPGRRVAEALGADPWGVLASGALLAAFPQALANEAARVLLAEGHQVAAIGHAKKGQGVVFADGAPLHRFEQDEVARVQS
jgi:hydrogenase expression/formation protein HypE